MINRNLLGPWIRRFLLEHLVADRNLADNTQASYRDTMALLLPFAASKWNRAVDRLLVQDISIKNVRAFMDYLERDRKCSLTTRNQRLAAIHAFARFVGEHAPEYVAWSGEIRAVPFKKAPKPTMTYLEKHEMDALLNSPNRQAKQGFKDYAMLLFLYNSGARADEVAQLRIADLDLGRSPSVKILGKGRKTRLCPLWSIMVNILETLLAGRPREERVFLNRRGQPITRFGIHALVKRHVLNAGQKVPSLRTKRISPHTIRHTTAVHLLRAGVDINTIRAWLGHVSLDTTNIYAEVDLEMKAEALSHCEITATRKNGGKPWRDNHDLMDFLRSLQKVNGDLPRGIGKRLALSMPRNASAYVVSRGKK